MTPGKYRWYIPRVKKNIVPVLLIIAVGLLVYSNVFHGSFVFDDFPEIRDNQLIKDIAFFFDLSRAEASPGYDSFQGRFIGYLSFALNYRIHGLDVAGYHAVNVAIHIINGVLVFLLTLLTFMTPFFRARASGLPPRLTALAAGLLFVSHPVQTQAVAYIVQRFASLATLFLLLSLVLYVQWRFQTLRPEGGTQKTGARQGTSHLRSVPWYLGSVLCAVLAMKTKQIAFTLPVIIALYEFLFFEGRVQKRVLALVPLILTMTIIPVSLIAVDQPVGEIIGDVSEATRVQTALSRGDYLATQLRVIVTYLRLLVLPVNQNLDYDYPVYHSFFHPAVFASFLLLASLAGLGLFLLHRSRAGGTVADYRLIAFGVFWFFITLSVESSVIPIVDVIYEHRLYLPGVGMFIAAAGAAGVIARRLRFRRLPGDGALILALIVVIGALGTAAYNRNEVWRDEVSLWEDVVRKSPNKARGHNNLGTAYRLQGSLDKAIEQYLVTLQLKPDYAEVHVNLGLMYLERGQKDRARAAFEEALRIKPSYVRARQFLLYLDAGPQ